MNSKLAMELTSRASLTGVCVVLLALFAGCRQKPAICVAENPQQRYESAKALFEKASRDFHIPSAQARDAERAQLENRAMEIYHELARQYSDQPIWAAQALRSLGNIHAARTNLTEAVRAYSEVAEKFPTQDFEVLMAWKSAGDLLWDVNRTQEWRIYYEKLVARFDKPEALPLVKAIVRGAKGRLKGELLLSAGNGQ